MKEVESSETDLDAVLQPSRNSIDDTATAARITHAGDGHEVSGTTATDVRLRFEDLYREHFAFVWRSLRALGVSPTSLDDAVQDVFVVVHRQLEGFEQRASPRTWIVSIAHHVASNYRRRERRKGGLLPLDPEAPSVRPDPENQLGRAQAWEFIQQFLDGLDESKRAVFVLTQLEGMKAAEVAEALNIPTNTVYTRLFHARNAFREALILRDRGGSR